MTVSWIFSRFPNSMWVNFISYGLLDFYRDANRQNIFTTETVFVIFYDSFYSHRTLAYQTIRDSRRPTDFGVTIGLWSCIALWSPMVLFVIKILDHLEWKRLTLQVKCQVKKSKQQMEKHFINSTETEMFHSEWLNNSRVFDSLLDCSVIYSILVSKVSYLGPAVTQV